MSPASSRSSSMFPGTFAATVFAPFAPAAACGVRSAPESGWGQNFSSHFPSSEISRLSPVAAGASPFSAPPKNKNMAAAAARTAAVCGNFFDIFFANSGMSNFFMALSYRFWVGGRVFLPPHANAQSARYRQAQKRTASAAFPPPNFPPANVMRGGTTAPPAMPVVMRPDISFSAPGLAESARENITEYIEEIE